MADNPSLNPFRNPDGSTSYAGQQNAGQWQKANGQTPAPQQSWESAAAYQNRINASK